MKQKIELIKAAVQKYTAKFPVVDVTRDDFDDMIKRERIVEQITDDIYVCDSGLRYIIKVRASSVQELKALRKFDFEW